jgi:hypothetical protein
MIARESGFGLHFQRMMKGRDAKIQDFPSNLKVYPGCVAACRLHWPSLGVICFTLFSDNTFLKNSERIPGSIVSLISMEFIA